MFNNPSTPPPIPARLRRPQRSPKVASGAMLGISRIHVTMSDSSSAVILMALKTHGISKHSLFYYNLFIVYGDQEYFVTLDEEPLLLFRKLASEGKNPVFMLRKKYAREETTNLSFLPED
jgi:hypothetical protein